MFFSFYNIVHHLFSPFVAEMAHGRMCCGAGWCRVLEDVGEDCMGLLAEVMFFSSTYAIWVDLSPRVTFLMICRVCILFLAFI